MARSGPARRARAAGGHGHHAGAGRRVAGGRQSPRRRGPGDMAAGATARPWRAARRRGRTTVLVALPQPRSPSRTGPDGPRSLPAGSGPATALVQAPDQIHVLAVAQLLVEAAGVRRWPGGARPGPRSARRAPGCPGGPAPRRRRGRAESAAARRRPSAAGAPGPRWVVIRGATAPDGGVGEVGEQRPPATRGRHAVGVDEGDEAGDWRPASPCSGPPPAPAVSWRMTACPVRPAVGADRPGPATRRRRR